LNQVSHGCHFLMLRTWLQSQKVTRSPACAKTHQNLSGSIARSGPGSPCMVRRSRSSAAIRASAAVITESLPPLRQSIDQIAKHGFTLADVQTNACRLCAVLSRCRGVGDLFSHPKLSRTDSDGADRQTGIRKEPHDPVTVLGLDASRCPSCIVVEGFRSRVESLYHLLAAAFPVITWQGRCEWSET
jgi:hypothetical protein